MITSPASFRRTLLFSSLVIVAPHAYGITCAQGSRSIVATSTQFCPTCRVHPAPTRSATLLNRSTCLQCSLFCPMTAREPADGGDAARQSADEFASGTCAETSEVKPRANGPLPIALLVDWSTQTELIDRHPEVAAALALMEWNGQRSGLIRDDEFVVSFLGSPTSSTVPFIRENGPISDFDTTFSDLPHMHALRVSVTLRAPSGGDGYDMIVVTTKHQGEHVVEALVPVVLRGSGVLATVTDASGAGEQFFAVELGRVP